MRQHKISEAEKRRKEHFDSIKRKKERESHLNRVSKIARKKANVTGYQKMAMQILDEMGINYVYEKPIQHFKSFYLIDIYLPEYKICIEVDGNAHDLPEKQQADFIRDSFLKSRGYWVFRIRNENVRTDLYDQIRKCIACRKRNMEK